MGSARAQFHDVCVSDWTSQRGKLDLHLFSSHAYLSSPTSFSSLIGNSQKPWMFVMTEHQPLEPDFVKFSGIVCVDHHRTRTNNLLRSPRMHHLHFHHFLELAKRLRKKVMHQVPAQALSSDCLWNNDSHCNFPRWTLNENEIKLGPLSM